jgi:hypothetical protein
MTSMGCHGGADTPPMDAVRGSKLVRATAFFDSIAFDDVWQNTPRAVS